MEQNKLNNLPIISVVVPTRNRPELLLDCLKGIAEQSFHDYEVIIVDDGSTSDERGKYETIIEGFGERFRLHKHNPDGSSGAGPSIIRNVGIQQGQGKYIAFCDDDDFWCNEQYLETAVSALEQSQGELFFGKMQILNPEGEIIVKTHMTNVDSRAQQKKPLHGFKDVYPLSLEDILCHPDYAHLNITILKKELAEKINGFWEYTTFAEDVDFFVKACEKAKGILYCTTLSASHNAPEKREGVSISNSIIHQNKRLLETNVYQHLLLACDSEEASRYTRLSAAYLLKTMTQEALAENKLATAAYLSRLALSYKVSAKWLGYMLYLNVKSFFKARF
jgi:glycosyltransferase involved in cell wall biosynthesis